MGCEKTANARYEQILLLGCDVNPKVIESPRATERDRCQRSDAIVVLSLDKVSGRVKLIDLFRDVWVPIPGHGMGKLNEVIVHGGPEASVQVINEQFDLCIRHYVQVSVTGLVELIDLFGGVDVKLTADEVHYINARMPEVMLITERSDPFPTVHTDGWNHLNGIQTLAHVRNRTIGYIVGRENRINNVLKSMARRVSRELRPDQCLRLALLAKKHVKTDLSFWDILRLLRFALHVNPDTITAYHAPAEGTFQVKNDFTWRMEVDFERANKMLWNFIVRPD